MPRQWMILRDRYHSMAHAALSALAAQPEPVAGAAPVTVQEAARVLLIAESLEAWAQCARDGRPIDPSVVGLMDMALTLRALAQKGGA
jgi:hypothetical protein